MKSLATICSAVLTLALALPALAQPAAAESPQQAREILMRMAGYLAGASAFSVSLRSGYDVVQKSGQKVEFGETRRWTNVHA